jgi:heptaprenyl diphosphate synthase
MGLGGGSFSLEDDSGDAGLTIRVTMSTSPSVGPNDLARAGAGATEALLEYWHMVPGMRVGMKEVDELLVSYLEEDPSPAVRRVSLHLINAGGKRLRPALVLLSSKAIGADTAVVTRLAVAMELLHVATLYHDDVIDGAATRRGLPSSNALWGDRVSALAGTYLIARAMDILAAHGDEVLSLVNLAINQVWQGEMREVEGVYSLDRTEAAYLECIANKTAAFYQLPCCLGLLGAAGDARQMAALRRYGQFTGMGFQLVDDLLDLLSSDDAIGKPAGSDIKAGVYTLAVIRTLQTSSRLEALLSGDTLSEKDCREALHIVRAGDGIDYAFERAREFIDKAIAELDVLPQGPAVRALGTTARSIIERPE